MARVTVEDCLQHVDNRFHLVLVATKRARKLATTGVDPLVPPNNDKPAVIALREIAAGFVKDGEICDPNAAPVPAEPEQPTVATTATAAPAPTFATGGITLESVAKAKQEQNTEQTMPKVESKLTVPLSPPVTAAPATSQDETKDETKDETDAENKQETQEKDKDSDKSKD